MPPTPKTFSRLADLAALAGLIASEIDTRKGWDPRSEEVIGNEILREVGVASFRRQVYTLRLLQRSRQVGKAVKPRMLGLVVAMHGRFT